MSAAHHRTPRPAPAGLGAKCRLGVHLTLLSGALASGCAPRPLYDWGGYEDSLQASYVAHDQAKARSDLEATITAVQQTGGRMPPGVYAEYGFLLYQGGQRERAIEYFQLEAQLFPESKPLMDTLIAKVRERSSAAAPPRAGDSVQ